MTRAHIKWLMMGLLAVTAAASAGQVCCKIGERMEGDKKVCVYQCRMKMVSTTIAADQTCPRTVNQ